MRQKSLSEATPLELFLAAGMLIACAVIMAFNKLDGPVMPIRPIKRRDAN